MLTLIVTESDLNRFKEMIMVEILTNMHRQDLTPRPPKNLVIKATADFRPLVRATREAL